MIRTNLCLDLFLIFAVAISIPEISSGEFLDDIEDDPVQGLFSEAVLQSHLNERVSNFNQFHNAEHISRVLFEYFG